MNKKIVVLVASDDAPRARSLCDTLCRIGSPQRSIEAASSDLLHAVSELDTLKPDVLLLDRGETTIGAWSAADALLHPPGLTRCVLLCAQAPPAVVVEAVRAGVAGYLSWDTDPALLAKAIDHVHAGQSWFGRAALHETLQQIVGAPTRERLRPDQQGRLTAREEEILELIGSGLSNKEIGRRLTISDKTVKTHLHRVYVKLNMSGRYKAFMAQPPATARGPAQPSMRWTTLPALSRAPGH